jgi:mono/diheme cytochrome c family protein
MRTLHKIRLKRFLPYLIVTGCLLLSTISGAQAKQNRTGNAANTGTNQGQLARGKYIVEGVAMCGMCHTPRTDSGEIDRERWLDGAALWLLPAHPVNDWPLKAPRLAGSPAASDEELVRLLTTGIWKTGTNLRPPMPQFRMSREDADAVVAYLRSLTPHGGD